MLLLLAIFWFTLKPATDLDLGWHLRYGQYFFQTGQVLKQNILSFVWPDFAWVQASWGYDLLLYPLFQATSFIGLSVAASLIMVLIFWLLTRSQPMSIPTSIALALIFISHTKPLYGEALRAQTPSALMFTLALLTALSPQFYFFLPFIFLIWANLHGGFALGLILVSILFFSHQPNLRRLLILALAWVIPLLNPWGFRLYQEAFRHSTNLNLTLINEWRPLTTWPIEAVVAGLVALLVLIMAVKRRPPRFTPYLLAFGFATYLAFSALRFVPLLGIMAVYFLARHLKLNLFSLIPFLLALTIIDPPYHPLGLPQTWDQVCQLSHDCSEATTQIMRADPPSGNGYHPYYYGGYLSWRVPQVKTFIDGRMSAWQDQGHRTPPILEGDFIIERSDPLAWKRFEAEYRFNWAIVPTSAPITKYLDELTKLDQWRRPYQDEWFSYYVKQN